MEGEDVHHGRRSPTRAIRGAELADEPRRRDRVAAGARPVDTARRQRTADHAHARRHRLQRVVGLGEQRQVGGRGRSGAVGGELRQPEAVQVRLVADDHVAEARIGAGEIGRERGELRPILGRERRRPRARVEDRDVDTDVRELGRCRHVLQDPALGRARRQLARLPDRGHPHGPEAGELEQRHLRLRLDEARAANDVLGGPERQRRAPGVRGRREHERRQKCEKPPSHPRHGSVVL